MYIFYVSIAALSYVLKALQCIDNTNTYMYIAKTTAPDNDMFKEHIMDDSHYFIKTPREHQYVLAWNMGSSVSLKLRGRHNENKLR